MCNLFIIILSFLLPLQIATCICRHFFSNHAQLEGRLQVQRVALEGRLQCSTAAATQQPVHQHSCSTQQQHSSRSTAVQHSSHRTAAAQQCNTAAAQQQHSSSTAAAQQQQHSSSTAAAQKQQWTSLAASGHSFPGTMVTGIRGGTPKKRLHRHSYIHFFYTKKGSR